MKPQIRKNAASRRVAWSGAVAVCLLLVVSISGADASTRSDLQSARDRLHALEARIASQRARLEELKSQAQAVADLTAAAQARLADTRGQQEITKEELSQAQRRFGVLQGRLDERARFLYMNGAQSVVGVVLNSTSFSEFQDRLEFVGTASQADADLANQVQNAANVLEQKQATLRSLERRQTSALQDLQRQQATLDQQLSEQQNLYAGLAADRSDLAGLVGDLSHKLTVQQREAAQAAVESAQMATGSSSGTGGPGPLQTCPVDGPVAYSDDFGAPRYGGGYHTHQGNDMFAPSGTPIVAPFPGTASDSSNTLGGLAVTVSGGGGFVYNAHMSRIGQLGSVSTGDVIGYVGDSGDAQGTSPHDHFEWHPGGGGAVDPYPYLNQVC
jgi:peptidoglycan hydrolase CwlO-like protein